MMKRKLRLGALLTVSVLMLALLIGGLYGTFDDTESSIGNTFTAGSLNLVSVISGTKGNVADNMTVNEREDGVNDNVTFGEVYPGASGNITWTLTNTGTLNGTLVFGVAVSGDENGLVEPELAMIPADNATASELITRLSCTLYDGATPVPGITNFATLQSVFNGVSAGLDAGATRVYRLQWSCSGAGFDNSVQTDTAQINMTFVLNQV